MSACQYPGCTVELPPRIGRGRPDEYCAEHKRARKREQDNAKYERDKAARIISEKPQSIGEDKLFQCCIDWRLAGRSNRTICPQHKTWRAFIKHARDFFRTSIRHNGQSTGQDLDTIVSLVESGRGVRVSADPDSWMPVDRDDKQQDKDLADWVDAGMPGAAEMKESRISEPVCRLPYGRQVMPATAARINDTDRQVQKMKFYKTEARAFKRVEVLTNTYGICPGVIKGEDGCYHLSYDPDPLDLVDD